MNQALEDAIEILVRLMNDLAEDPQKASAWYLGYFKLRSAFHYLVDEKYGLNK